MNITLPSLVLMSGLAFASFGQGKSDTARDLFRAINHGDKPAIKQLLQDASVVSTADSFGNTPLMQAAFYGDAEYVKIILAHGANVNATNRAGATALMRGANDVEKVKLLLTAGANVKATSRLGNSAIILAARNYGASRAVQLLLDHGANPNATNLGGATPLIAAAAADDVDSVRLLLQRGADANAMPGGNFFLGGQRNALMWAAFRGNIAIARELLAHGARINDATGFGTPLSQAAWSGKTEMARFLIDHGANVSQKDAFSGYTPLHWAASIENGDPGFTKVLLTRGADPSVEGGKEVSAFLGKVQTPLGLAQLRGSTPLVAALLSAKAKPGETFAGRTVAVPSRRLPDQLDDTVVRHAVENALRPIQITADGSRTAFMKHASRQDCVSCHQQYLPMAAVGLARHKRVELDAEAARRQIKLALYTRGIDMKVGGEDPDELILQATFHPEPAFSYAFALFGLDAEREPANDVTDALVHGLAAIQGRDGQWHSNLPRPPIQSTDISATALSVHGLQAYPLPGRQKEFDARIARAKKWLWAQHTTFNEERVFQLLGLKWAGEPASRLTRLTRNLAAEQRPDGGWSQLPGLTSDAYATGQALYALSEGGGMEVNNTVFQSGLRYLLTTQLEDGTWYVRRRAFPFQPTMDSGFPHGRDSWVSASGSSWAVMAMTTALDASKAYLNSPRKLELASVLASPPRIAGTMPTTLRYENDIKPFLEKSCFGCHSANRPSAGYRVDSREAMLRTRQGGTQYIVAGQSAKSHLIRMVADQVDDLEMPPIGKRDKHPALTREQIDLLRLWIDQGAAR